MPGGAGRQPRRHPHRRRAACLRHVRSRPSGTGPLGEETLLRCRSWLGPDHLITLTAVTSALAALGRSAAALTLGKQTLRQAQQSLGAGHPITIVIANRLCLGMA